MQIAGVRLSCEGEKEFSAALRQAATEAKRMGRDLQKLDATYGKGSKNTDYLTQKQELLTRQLEQQRKRTETLRQVRESYLASGNADAAKLEKLGDAIQSSEVAEARLARQIADTNAQLEEQQRAAEKAASGQEKLAKTGKKLKETGDKAAKAGDKLTKTVTDPLVARLTASAKASMDFETAFASVRKTVDASDETYEELEETLWDMSEVMPQTAVDLAGLMAAAGQLGVDTDNLAQFTKVVANLGVATNLTAEDAATLLAQYANITQMPLEDIERLGSVIVALGNNMATTEADITALAQRLASTGSLIGLSDAQIMGLSAAMASLGVEAEAGGTAMSKTLQLMQTAVLGNTRDLKSFAKVAGVSAKEFAAQWQADPLTALESFLTGLNDINTAGGDAAGALKSTGLTDTRMVDVLLRMAGAGDLLAESLSLANSAWAENTALQNEADAANSTTANQLAMTRNSLIRAGDALGQVMLPYIQQGANMVQELAQGFASLDTGTQGTIVKFAALAAAIGPVVSAGGRLVSTFGKLLPMLVSPAGLAVAGVAGVGLLTYALIDAADATKRMDEGFKSIDLQVDEDSVAQISAAIDRGIAAADKVYEISLEVKANVDPLREQVDEVFEDGKMTWRERRTLSKDLQDEIDKEIVAAQQLLEDRKRKINDMLDSLTDEQGEPLYTEEEKAALADQALSGLSAATEELTTLQTDLDTLLAEIAASGGTATEAQLAELEALLDRIEGVEQRVRELQNDDIQDARNAYIAQSGGYGNEDTFGEAIGYGKQTETNRRKELGQRRDEAEQAYLASIAAMQENGASQAEMDEAYAAYLAREQAFNEEEAAILAERDEIFANSWKGVAKQYPEGEKVLEDMGDLISMGQMVQEAMNRGGLTDEEITTIFSPENVEKYFSGYADMINDAMEGPAWARTSINGVWDNIAASWLKNLGKQLGDMETENGDALEPFSNAIQAMIAKGVDFDSLDWSAMDGSMQAAMLLHLLGDDENGGVEAWDSELGQKILDAMQGAVDALEAPEVDAAGWTETTGNAIPQAMLQGAPATYAQAQEIADNAASTLSQASVNGSAWQGAAAGIGDDINAGGAAAVAAAWNLRREIEAVLAGTNTRIILPDIGGEPGPGEPGDTTSPGQTGNDNSVTVYVGTANMGNRTSLEGFARELSALQSSKLAGLGNMG